MGDENWSNIEGVGAAFDGGDQPIAGMGMNYVDWANAFFGSFSPTKCPCQVMCVEGVMPIMYLTTAVHAV